jgi:hypothetical protein
MHPEYPIPRNLSTKEMPSFSLVDNCHVTVYSADMIKTFAINETQQLFIVGKSRRLAPDSAKRAVRRLEYIHYATN